MRRRKYTKTPGQPTASPKPMSDVQERPIVVLFADIVSCSEISNHKGVTEYNRFLDEFHTIFRTVTAEHELLYPENEQLYFKPTLSGDEGCLMIFVPNRDDLSEDIDATVNIALDLKRRWLLSRDNEGRIKDGLLPSELAIGIHLGKAFINEQKGKKGKDRYRPEGYAINLAKRIEGSSREGHFTRIYVSEAARNELYLLTDEATYTLTGPHSIQPKGISRDIRVFEVKHHFLPTDWNKIRTSMSDQSTANSAAHRGKSRAILFRPTGEDVDYSRQT